MIRKLLLILSLIALVISHFVESAPMILGLNVFVIVGLGLAFVSLLLTMLTPSHHAGECNSRGTLIYFGVMAIVTVAVVILAVQYLPNMNDSESGKRIALPLTCAIMLAIGFGAKHIKMNRYLGLRMPWVYLSEARWDAAHLCLYHITLPLTVIYAAVAFSAPASNLACISIVALVLWTAIPSVYPLLKKI